MNNIRKSIHYLQQAIRSGACESNKDYALVLLDDLIKLDCGINDFGKSYLDVRAFLFARWLATSYADEHLDNEMRYSDNEGFDSSTAMSVLNREGGEWYKEQLKYFNNEVLPNYIKRGSFDSAKEFLN